MQAGLRGAAATGFRRHVKALSTFARQSWWKHPNGVEPGLYFRPVELPAQAEILTACVRDGWIAAGETRDFDADVLLREAAERPTLSAYIEGESAGILQLNPEKEAAEKVGWISLYCMATYMQLDEKGAYTTSAPSWAGDLDSTFKSDDGTWYGTIQTPVMKISAAVCG